MIYIGIDTGTNTGIAVWDNRQRSFISVGCVAIHKALKIVEEYHQKALEAGTRCIVRVEDPRQRTWFKQMPREEERKKLQGVGSVKRDASIWEDFLEDLGVEYEMVAPKRNVTKLPQDRFEKMTGWNKSTNEHGRDAAMLVFGR